MTAEDPTATEAQLPKEPAVAAGESAAPTAAPATATTPDAPAAPRLSTRERRALAAASGQARPTPPRTRTPGSNPMKSLPRRATQQRWARKLHIWISMFSLTLMLFFGATGFVLNHTEWSWGQTPVTTKVTGTLAAAYLNPVDVNTIATYLRGQQDIFGEVVSNSTSGTSLTIATAGPGATSSVIVDTSTGAFTATKTMNGFVAFLTDLHRGNSVGKQWGWVVDATAIALIVISLTGLVIGILNRSRHWSRDMLLAFGGLAAAIALLLLSAP